MPNLEFFAVHAVHCLYNSFNAGHTVDIDKHNARKTVFNGAVGR